MNNSNFRDVKIQDFDGLKKIHKFTLTSKSTNLDTIKLKASFLLKPEYFPERDLLINNKAWPIFSPKFAKVLEKFNLPYRKFSIEMFDENKKKLPTCLSLQIPLKTGIVDVENSVFTPSPLFPNNFDTLTKLSLHIPDNCEQIFRIQEKIDLLLIQEDLKKALEKENINGVVFVPMKEYSSLKLFT